MKHENIFRWYKNKVYLRVETNECDVVIGVAPEKMAALFRGYERMVASGKIPTETPTK